MSPNSLRVDCRKFVPNIFNKTKCSNCFKQKEEHSAEALECNRAMRKVAKSGYLFVAPDWDFSIPLNRTKRWQRRWFVLYDDGELNYSVDEHPDTVPQASIDMNTVLEVAGAEDVTGHVFSFAITAPDRVTFVKGVAREEARAWTSVLAVYTRNKRHKRNATFPGGQTTTIHQTHHTPRSGTPNPIRPRYNSCHSESMRPPIRWSQEKPSSETPKATEIIKNTTIPAPEIITTVKNTTIPTSTNLVGNISPIGTLSTSSSSTSCSSTNYRNTGYRDQPPSSASPPTRDKLNSEEKAFARRTNKHKKTPETPDCVDSPIDDYETSSKRLETLKDIAQILTRPRSAPGPTPNTPTRDSDTEERLNLPAETLLHLKKGWLMLKSDNQWIKLWFVLCGQELKAFKDSLEDLEEFKVRLSQIKSVGEITVQRNYGFQINLWNDNFYVLSAVTSGIRSNWLETVRRAASLNDLPPRPTRLILSSDEEYRTASEGGRRESGEWAPVSPPLARTPISRVKERAKTRSRTSTLDSVSTDELLSADLQKLQINLQRSEEDKFLCLNQLKETLEKYETLNRDYLNKNTLNNNLQEELNCVNERLKRGIEENDFLYKKLQELEKNSSFGSFSDLTNIDLDLDFKNITLDNLIDEYNNLKNRFEKAVEEIKAMKRELRNSNIKYDDLELSNITLKQDLQKIQSDNKYENNMMAARIQDLTQKLTNSEKQVRNLKSKLQDSREKRRSLSLKGRESFSINKEVEDKINELEAKVLNLETSKKSTKKQQNSDLEKKNQRRLRRKSLDSTTSEPMKLLIKLSCLESKVANFDNFTTSNENLNQSDANSKILSLESTIEAVKIKLNDCQNELRNFNYEQLATLISEAISILKNQNNVTSGEVDVITNSVVNLVQNFEKLLTNKLLELNKKRKKLRESNMLTSQNSLAILAEKLAYETVLISRINEALNTIHSPETKFSSRILRKEIFETSNLLQQLENKICSQSVKIAPKSLENHLVKVLTSHLIQINYLTNNNRNYSRNCEDLSKSLQYLLEKQQKVNQQLQQYKSEKMEQLVYNLALETLNFNQDDEKSVKEVWKSAQESVGLELIQAEISHVLSRVAQVYSSSENEPFLTVWAAEKAALELFGDVLEERLQKELKSQAEELKIAVKGVVNKLRPTTPWRRRLELERKSYSGNNSLLTEFANILTHKALIDARISILSEEVDVFSPPSETFLPVDIFLEGQRYLWLLEDSSNLTSNSIHQAEFQTLFFNFQKVASSEMTSIEHQVPNQVKEALFGVENEVARLQNDNCGRNEVNCWKDVVKKCLELKERLEKVPQVVKCEKCQQLKDSLHRLSREHSLELAVQESTQSQLRERAFLLEQRLGTLDTEYAKQLEQLRTAYRETLTTPSPASSPGESASEGLRARYQAEIEQLRALCEKGLAAVESTHRRVVTELQDKHRREREHLLEEKEQALAEETQATLAALDAMRKAHEHEVRREVTKFKADFLRRLQATHDLGALHQQHESEMREIKKEILALSERYSVKCVESASLEEQLCSVHQQLDNANKYIEQLDKRNKQLEAVAIAGTS